MAKVSPSRASKTGLKPDEALDKATEFGKYQLFLLIVLLWGNVIDTSNIVFMVFGEADATTCQNTTAWEVRWPNGSLHSNGTNCTSSSLVFNSMLASFPSLDKYTTAWLTSVQYTGAIFGALIGGYLADRIGRRYNTWLWLTCELSLGALSSLMPSWQAMMAMRFFIGFATGGYDASVIILLMEWANARTRLVMQNALMCVNSFAFIWFAFLAFLCRDIGWRWLAVVSNLQGLPLLVAFLAISETPRWLMEQGRSAEARAVVEKVGRWNGHRELGQIDEDAWEEAAKEAAAEAAESRATSYLDFLGSRSLIVRILMVAYSYFVTGFVGYVFVFNVGNLSGSIFLNFAILGAVNIGAATILSGADRFLELGRRVVHQVSMIGVTVFILVMIGIFAAKAETEVSGLLIAAAMIGSMFSFPLWTVSGLYAGELFPTNLRNKSCGIGTMTSIVGGILTPQVLTLFKGTGDMAWVHSRAFVIVVATVIVNVVLAWFLLPETRGKLTEKKEIQEEDAKSIRSMQQ